MGAQRGFCRRGHRQHQGTDSTLSHYIILTLPQILGIPVEKTNVAGGGVSLGHPIGSSGCRIVCTLLNLLLQRALRYGCAAICNGGGGATAIVIERL